MPEPQGKVCIGFGEHESLCRNAIDQEAFALNRSGLWCVRCELTRRNHISRAFEDIRQSFGKGKVPDA